MVPPFIPDSSPAYAQIQLPSLGMSFNAALIVLAAGFLAGAINTIVGSGSLITFPALLAVGLTPVVANVSNTVGLVFGSISGTLGYRRELAGQGKRVLGLLIPTIAGSALGAALLLTLLERFFNRIVPAFVLVALVLVVIQPRLTKSKEPVRPGKWRARLLPFGVFSTAIYGGYFGAAQGVILISLLAVLVDDSLQRLNALKNVLSMIVNAVAAAYFVIGAHVAWSAAAMVAIGSVAGAQVGAFVARRLPPTPLRIAIVIGGVAALAKLLI